MQRCLCGSDIYDCALLHLALHLTHLASFARSGDSLVPRPCSQPFATSAYLCFGYESPTPDWQPCQVVGQSGASQAWACESHQHIGRQLSCHRDSSGGRTTSDGDASNRSCATRRIKPVKPTLPSECSVVFPPWTDVFQTDQHVSYSHPHCEQLGLKIYTILVVT